MDQTSLRLVLLALGSLLVVGIYLWDRYQQDKPRYKRIRTRKKYSSSKVSTSVATPAAKANSRTTAPSKSAKPAKPPEQLTLKLIDTNPQMSQKIDASIPPLILQLHIVAREGVFSAADIKKAAQAANLQYGAMQIFHRHSKAAKKPLFSLASMFEPGILPLGNDTDFHTSGLTLFAQLSGQQDHLATYREMVFCAQHIAGLLQADLRNEKHAILTQESIEHAQDNIVHYQNIRFKNPG